MGNQQIRVDGPKLLSDAKDKLGEALPAKEPPDIEYFAIPLAYKQHAREMFDAHCFLSRYVLVQLLQLSQSNGLG